MKHLFFLIFLALLALSSCKDSPTVGKGGRPGQPVTGKVGEILVVCDNSIWESEIKAHLDTNLTRYIMPYWPDVATFTLIHKDESKFNQGVKRVRNVLFLTIDPLYQGTQASMHKQLDLYALDQMVVEITAKDQDQLLSFCKKGLKTVHSIFDDIEWRRIMNYYNTEPNQNVDKAIAKNFGIKLSLPTGTQIVSKRPNFYRIEFPLQNRPLEFSGTNSGESGAIFSGIMIYQYPYRDSSQFFLENLLQARDTMLKYNAPHEFEGMYMGTQYHELVYPEGSFMESFDGKVSGYEMRGMYQFVGRGKHGTGGAFWAYHFVNPKTDKLVCVSGYLDAPPTTSWTHFLREIQAVLKSVEITN